MVHSLFTSFWSTLTWPSIDSTREHMPWVGVPMLLFPVSSRWARQPLQSRVKISICVEAKTIGSVWVETSEVPRWGMGVQTDQDAFGWASSTKMTSLDKLYVESDLVFQIALFQYKDLHKETQLTRWLNKNSSKLHLHQLKIQVIYLLMME